jgi:hypothetical protein
MPAAGSLRGSDVWSLESLMGRASRAERKDRAKEISVMVYTVKMEIGMQLSSSSLHECGLKSEVMVVQIR